MDDLPDEMEVLRGRQRTIAYARDARGTMYARDYLEGREAPEKDKRALDRAFEVMAEQGRIHNTERFRHEDGEIFAFKSFQVRIPAFRVGDTWFLTHGFKKKRDRWPPGELDRAERIRKEHMAWMEETGR